MSKVVNLKKAKQSRKPGKRGVTKMHTFNVKIEITFAGTLQKDVKTVQLQAKDARVLLLNVIPATYNTIRATANDSKLNTIFTGMSVTSIKGPDGKLWPVEVLHSERVNEFYQAYT